MEFKCSVCGYTSTERKNVVRHLAKKKSCGPGIKEIVEIAVEIKCEYCNKKFSTAKTLAFHIKNTCTHKNDALEEENRRLKEENKLLKAKAEKSITTINNDNRVYNIMVVNYEQTSLAKISDKDINKILTDAESHQIIPRLIKEVHFNPDIPENHNIYISNRNRNNKHLNIFRNGQWEVENKASELDNLISDKETNLSDWIDEKGKKYPEALEKFNEYLDQKYDEDTAKLVKEEVELVLYNNRHLVKNQVQSSSSA